MRLRRFFMYYGAKTALASKYPKPSHDDVIEPFAGSAGYSLLHHSRRVHLYDSNPTICGVWEYLIGVSETELLQLPACVEDTTALPIPQEAKDFIGFWLEMAVTKPAKTPSAWCKQRPGRPDVWGEKTKQRIASQLRYIRHWSIKNIDYALIPNIAATWYIDPPYQGKAGKKYPHNAIDYPALGQWCKGRNGQVIACEAAGADWLPFTHLTDMTIQRGKLSKTKVTEMIWLNG